MNGVFTTSCRGYMRPSRQSLDDILSQKTLEKANFCMRDLNGKDLGGRNLSDANFTMAKLVGANLSGSIMCNVELWCASINESTILDNVVMSLALPEWNSTTLNQRLNSQNQSSSLLKTIDDISDRYYGLKVQLMLQIINSLNSLEEDDMEQIADPLLKILYRGKDYETCLQDRTISPSEKVDEIYLKNSEIRSFVTNKLIGKQITAANSSKLKIDDHKKAAERRLQLFLYIVTHQEEKKEFILKNNGFFIQLMMQCTEQTTDPEIIKQAQELYFAYLDLPELCKAAKEVEFNGDRRLVEGLDDNDFKKPVDAGLCFVFYQKEGGINHLLLCNRTQIIKRISADNVADKWSEIYYLTGELGKETFVAQPSTDIFSKFNLFRAPYETQKIQARFPKLLTEVNLHYTGTDYQSKDYGPIFSDAVYQKSSKNLTEHEDQFRLTAIFEPLFKLDSIEITDEHCVSINSIYELANKSLPIQAQTFFCLAIIFVKFSSNYFFGTSDKSPHALRKYAAGLMSIAHKLDPNVFELHGAQNKYDEWMNEITGEKGASTCSANLSGTMFRYARTHFDGIFSQIVPLGWAV